MNFRNPGVAMLEFPRWRRVGAAVLLSAGACLAAGPAAAQPARAAAPVPSQTALDASLFYQLLVGEMQLRNGDPGTAYQAFMDAARRTNDPQLFRRAMDIALQARAGTEALAATRAWQQAAPDSADPLRLELQILTALNRLQEAGPTLAGLIRLTPPAERSGLFAALPRFFERAADKRQAATLLDEALAPYMDAEDTRTAAVVASGRAWLAAEDPERALALARRAAAVDPQAPGPMLLAMALRSERPEAEQLIVDHLARPDADPALRLAWARVLTAAQRYPESIAQLELATRQQPDQAPPWLMLGALHLELRHFAEADAALERYLALAQAPATEPAADPVAEPASGPAAEPAAASAAQAARPGASAASAATEGGTGAEGGIADTAGERAADTDTDTDPGAAPDAVEPEAAGTPTDDSGASDQGQVQAWLMLAQSAEQQGRFAAAEAWLARIDDPQRALEVQTRRALLMARQGEVDRAVASLRQVPERSPEEARAKLQAEAQLLRDVERWQAAYDSFETANQRFPDDIDLLYEQAMVAEKLDRLDDMERLLRQVIALQAEHAHAHNALGYSLADRGLRLQEARTLIQRALELRPGDPFITDSLGWVEYRLGNLAEAERLLRQAWSARPDTEIGAHLGEVLWAQGRRDEARAIWRQAQTRDRGNAVLRETLARLQVGL
jgi:tetratricopeptide (TPR) repeat protein